MELSRFYSGNRISSGLGVRLQSRADGCLARDAGGRSGNVLSGTALPAPIFFVLAVAAFITLFRKPLSRTARIISQKDSGLGGAIRDRNSASGYGGKIVLEKWFPYLGLAGSLLWGSQSAYIHTSLLGLAECLVLTRGST